jgi:hypothetical protein
MFDILLALHLVGLALGAGAGFSSPRSTSTSSA